ncbi:HTH-type transcriptional regulator YesS [Paenibacillus konkukensis]|uniref:HTH-type transcriptional regulator YesS n=1 Tax=Paenibacillus konkukensis TaxID=2020716 RepID=A0ABY4RWH2_9BACL|nr:helix-turn-helix domain-containing protein [Paenibacillus konkukensis]UQZ86348.1 HTH-type transcriptional regulator YesS [Paenibacillus konkukensis]
MRLRSLEPPRKKLLLLAMVVLFTAVLSYTATLLKMHLDTSERYVESFQSTHDNAVSLSFMLEKQIQSIYYQLTLERVLAEWLSQPEPRISNMYMLGEVQNNSLKIINSNPMIVSVYIYSKVNRTVLASNHEFTTLDQFPDKELFTEFNEKGGHWVGVREEKAGYFHKKDIITFVGPLGDQGLAAINIDERKLFGETPDAYGMVLLGKDGRVLASRAGYDESGNELRLERLPALNADIGQPLRWENYYVTAAGQTGGEWSILSYTPQIELSASWKQRRNGLAVLACVLAGLGYLIYGSVRRLYVQPMERLELSFNRNLEDLKHQFVLNVMNGKLKEPDIRDKMAETGLVFPSGRFRVIVFQIDDFYSYLLGMKQEERYFMDKTVYNAIKWTFMTSYPCYAVKAELEKIAILIAEPEELEERGILHDLEGTIRYLQKEIYDNCSLTICAGISRVHEGMNQVHCGYYEALQAVDFKTIYGKHSIIHYKDIAARKRDDSASGADSADIGRWLQLLREGETEAFESSLREGVERLVNGERFSLDRLNAFFSNVLYGMIKTALELRLDMSEIVQEDLFMKMYGYEFLQDKTDYVLQVAGKLSSCLAARKGSNNKTLQLIVDYIHANYDKSISLTTISDSLGINSSYISTLMKHEFGCGFVEYLNQLRIKKAQQLLEDPNLAIKRISEMCGYDTVHSFIRNFKKLHLFTPSEYRSKAIAKRNV